MQKRLMQFLVLVSGVGKGDLTRRGEVTADMFGNLADGFSLMIARFGQLLKQVREAADRVNKSAGTRCGIRPDMSGTAGFRPKSPCERWARSNSWPPVCVRLPARRRVFRVCEAGVIRNRTRKRRGAGTVRDMQSIRSAVQRMSKQVKGLGDRSSKFLRLCRRFEISRIKPTKLSR